MKEISYQLYRDKVYGGWIGKCAGGIIGAKQENNKSLMDYDFNNVFPEKAPPNDDFDLQILYLQEILEKRGFNFGEKELGDVFAKHNMCWANEYRIAIRNVNGGVYPPTSGGFNNDFFLNSMGCPIRSELWAYVAPGNPEFAARLCRMDGSIDHVTESIYAEIFFAAMECLAFFESDLNVLFDQALTYVPAGSRVAECAAFVRSMAAEEPDYRVTRTELIKRFGSSDASYAVTNLGIVVLALLYGKDFNDTMLTAVNCGYDTDCTSATAGAILGTILGRSGLPGDWVEKVGDDFVLGIVDVKRERGTLAALTEDTFRVCFAAARDGLIDLRFTGVPEDFVCDIPAYQGVVKILAGYEGEPSVSAERPCRMALTVRNERRAAVKGTLTLEAEESLELDHSKFEISLAPGEEIVLPVTAALADVELVPIRNVITATLHTGDETFQQRIGVFGCGKYRMYGPYFDNYDTEKYDHDINGKLMPKDLFDMFNGHSSIHREYLPLDRIDKERHTVIYTARDKLPIEENVGYQGACCVYLVRDLYSKYEQDVHMFLGDTAPHRVYLEDQQVAGSDRFVRWMPLNNVVLLHLKEGRNRLVFKLIRRNGPFEFSVFFSKLEFGDGTLIDVYDEK